MQRLRDHPDCARQEYDRLLDAGDPGLYARLTFAPDRISASPPLTLGAAHKVAILREQGVNGHMEMARAFHEAGFIAEDVTMSDLVAEYKRLVQQ